MRIFLGFLTMALISGCATAIPLTKQERCALDDMKLIGASSETTYGSSYNFRSGSSYAHRFDSASVQCAVPANDDEKREISNIQQIMTPKLEYNSSIASKRLLTGAGYFLYIIPGVGAKLYFDDQYDDAIKKSDEIEMQVRSRKPAEQYQK